MNCPLRFLALRGNEHFQFPGISDRFAEIVVFVSFRLLPRVFIKWFVNYVSPLEKNENWKTGAEKVTGEFALPLLVKWHPLGQAQRAPRPIVETGDIISVIDQRVNSRVTAFISACCTSMNSDEREFVRATSSPPIPVPAGIASE